jgi:hypothetical protein
MIVYKDFCPQKANIATTILMIGEVLSTATLIALNVCPKTFIISKNTVRDTSKGAKMQCMNKKKRARRVG